MIRHGRDERVVILDGLEVNLTEQVLNILEVPLDEVRRKHCRRLLFMAGSKFEPEVAAKIRKTLYKIEDKVRVWGLENNWGG